MIYPENFEQKVGFDQVRQWLRERCLGPLGQGRVDAMVFTARAAEVQERLEQTAEMLGLVEGDQGLPSSHYYDLRPVLKRVRTEGTWIDERELFDLFRSLQTVRDLVALLKKRGDGEGEPHRAAHTASTAPSAIAATAPSAPAGGEASADFSTSAADFSTSAPAVGEVSSGFSTSSAELYGDAASLSCPRLRRLAEDVETFPDLVRAISRILSPYGEVRDSASPQLAEIRRQLATTRGSISRLLMNILRAAQDEGLVGRDVSPTLRDGRLVIPVAPALKRRIGGIVHDESASGKTVFIEPAEVVEANNRVRQLQSEERREVVRILTAFTADLRPRIGELLVTYEFLADIDFIRAKALVAREMDATLPALADVCRLDWHQAVHPLLRQSLRRHGREPVPLDIQMDQGQRILVISGPNAGGKSVCLKTVGLLQYMLQCGLLLPVAPGSQAGLFTSLFIDIGDEQSIENELSTYSSHLTHMKQVLRHADDRSLVLIDEFGGGTEPRIGGAIAEAVLRRIHGRGAFAVVTTHYHNLKQFADAHEAVVNCAMLYDRQLMQPLFQLEMGQPGSSFAVEIARKIGLPDDVIADAAALVGEAYMQSDRYLLDIARDKRYWENKRQLIRQHERQMEQTLARYRQEAEELHAQRRDILRQAHQEAEELLRTTNARIEGTIREIREAQAERERTRQARQELQEWRERLHDELAADEADVFDAGTSGSPAAVDPAVDPILQRMERIRARQERRAVARAKQAGGGTSASSAASASSSSSSSVSATTSAPVSTSASEGVVPATGTAVPGAASPASGRAAATAGKREDDAAGQAGRAAGTRASGAAGQASLAVGLGRAGMNQGDRTTVGKVGRVAAAPVPEWHPGDAVRLRGQRGVGRVLRVSHDGSQVVVAFGQVKTTVASRRLEAAPSSGAASSGSSSSVLSSSRSSLSGLSSLSDLSSSGSSSSGSSSSRPSSLGPSSLGSSSSSSSSSGLSSSDRSSSCSSSSCSSSSRSSSSALSSAPRAATFLSAQTQDSIRRRQLDFSQELDVRGMRGAEAVQAVQYYIDDAILVGAQRVRILHGTGTGILRTLIRQYLATVPAIRHFADEHVQLGGAGITVVDL